MSSQVICWHEYPIDSLKFRLYSVPIQVGSVVTAVQLGDYGLPTSKTNAYLGQIRDQAISG